LAESEAGVVGLHDIQYRSNLWFLMWYVVYYLILWIYWYYVLLLIGTCYFKQKHWSNPKYIRGMPCFSIIGILFWGWKSQHSLSSKQWGVGSIGDLNKDVV
jgi:hypothetical protein